MSAEVVWVGWLVLFLVYEITAALRERGTPQRLTLSRNVWAWFDRAGEKVFLAVFLLTLTAHLSLGRPGAVAVIVTGAPVAAIIVWSLVRRKPTAAAAILALPLLLGADRCSISWPQPSPSPSAPPTAEPTPWPGCQEGECLLGYTNAVPPQPICGPCPTPGPTHPPQPTPTPSPEPTPPAGAACPKPLAPGAYAYLNDKPYGQGFDSTVRIHGDPELCRLVHGVAIDDCHLEGWPRRVECELELLGGCPIWQFSADGGKSWIACHDDHDAVASCDHYGSVEYRDDPQTPTTGDSLATLQGFEGQPLACGLQRDEFGPMAGFFTVAHGKGHVRACTPAGGGCGPWRPFDH